MQCDEKLSNVAKRLSAWTAISSLALIAVTWRLWTPQTVYPQVPLFASLCDAPLWIDWLGLGCALAGLVSLALSGRPRITQIGCATIFASLLLLFCLDQHRFQPWAYELWLFCGIWILCRHNQLRLRLMRWLLTSVYFYSAIGKLDFEFLHTVGQQMLAVVVSGMGFDVKEIPAQVRVALVATFPLLELAIAFALAWPKTQRLGGCFAIAVHLGLILILGPFGLNHRLGVLVWNAQVAVQAYWLFVSKPTYSKQTVEPEQTASSFPQWLAYSLIGASIVLPITERLGLWDHWPSWALYAPHSSRVLVEVGEPEVAQLPAELQRLVNEKTADPAEITIWLPVPIDRWSLQTLDTPIYPQARFQLGVAEKIAAEMNAGSQVRITVLGPAARLTGARSVTVYEGKSELSAAGNRFWVNHHPRNCITTP